MDGSAKLALSRPDWLSFLKAGDFLDRRRVLILGGVLLALELIVFLFLIAGTHGWIVPLERPTTTDFASFYAAGSLADAGTPALAYNDSRRITRPRSKRPRRASTTSSSITRRSFC